ncbi:MAG: hypothetical protein PHP85_02695 [Gallionella sp.]|nr:hypothetical protein [Gallionella sp.]
MSKIKSPDEKKRMSYEKDRRNVYGENSKASRKNIPRSKQRAHMAERHVAAELLRTLGPTPVESNLEKAEGEVKAKTRLQRLNGFKKDPDKPLAEVLKRRAARQQRLKQYRDRNGV